MLFRKKNIGDPRRARQPGLAGGARPVFSYHAQLARDAEANPRRVVRLPWAGDTDKPPLARRGSGRFPKKRIVMAVAVIAAVALVVNGLLLARDPVIVVHEEADGRQLLLRSQDVYREAAGAVLADSFANTNKLTINTDKIAQDLQKQFPELDYVSVVLPVFGRKPAVHIQTASPALILATNQAGGVFLVDESGRAIMDASKVSASVKQKLPVVQDESGLPVTIGRGVLPQGNVDFITEVIGQLSAKGVKISAMTLPAGASELDIRVEGQPYMVKFNLRGDARVEAGAFLAVKQHLEREQKTPSSYIDVRVDNKAYYR